MAGLQYKFFPTDFFFPRPQPPAGDGDGARPQLIPINTPNGGKIEDGEATKSLSLRQAGDKHAKAIPVAKKNQGGSTL
ncbi:hypothetical protein RHMOL_Rhmol04G0149300 [Rhododendron molle]|uniref:Uncharacterized protein n=2 Tax=Rhododendron molle TaxID=49168 RepID=A0ACC0P0Q7_RHOML|nr:hypothetical protein RHMOL_Rhmol04G0149100 [Rhododendron molle]KAI8559121.1 hypothetical protein RHMOL_Rhmol04G0149300 [Rhododendron molle]